MLAIAPGWELGVERGPDWLLVKVKSVDEDAVNAPPLADEIWSLLQCHFTYRLVLELDQIHLLNSHLVGQLVSLYKRIREHDGVMRLCGLSDFNRQVLQMCRLDDRFAPCRDRKEAVMGGGPHFLQRK
ncbi:MAG: STAS domain-containing protein [Candidatus Nealsonbacteria bacterium]|nr:STAS domain-containing protein [Candidatus Nealsonbacteria bacterium]